MSKEGADAVKNQYLTRLFGENYDFKNSDTLLVAEKALKRAEEIRDFEISLYWTRSAYFWGFQAVFFATVGLISQGLVNAQNRSTEDNIFSYILLIIIGISGAMISHVWRSMLDGAKFWQDNWERHIDVLEDAISGPLSTTYFVNTETLRRDPNFSPVSVTQANSYIAWFMTLAWLSLVIFSCGYVWLTCGNWLPSPNPPLVVFVVTIGIVVCSCLSSYRLCCTNPVRDSPHESSVVAGLHEQTHTPRLQDQELARL